jgi:hypothetical protein
MRFKAFPPLSIKEIFGNAWRIFASGNIEQQTPQELEKLIGDRKIPGNSLVFLDSLGGDLHAGMQLGRVIRQHRFRTYIGGLGELEEFDPVIGRLPRSKFGKCMSACALAFLGGEFRYLNGGLYGVHQFRVTKANTSSSDASQRLSAEVLQYLREMEVDTELFDEMTKTNSDDMSYLSEDRSLALGVINNGQTDVRWTLEAAGPHGLYLKGHRNTIYGEQKLMFIAASGNSKFVMMAMFQPQGNDAKIVEMPAISLLLDGVSVRIPSSRVAIKPTVMDGWASVMVALDDDDIERILHSKTVGLMAQHSFEAPVFLGIGEMDFSAAVSKLAALLASCHQAKNG